MDAPNKCKPNSATRDHIIPKSRGGTNQGQNIRLICRSCNIAKGNRMPTQEEVNSVRIPPNPNIEHDWDWFLSSHKQMEVRATTIEKRIEEVKSVEDVDNKINKLFLCLHKPESQCFEDKLRKQVGRALGITSGVILDTVAQVAMQLHNEEVCALHNQITELSEQAKECLNTLEHSVSSALESIQGLCDIALDDVSK